MQPQACKIKGPAMIDTYLDFFTRETVERQLERRTNSDKPAFCPLRVDSTSRRLHDFTLLQYHRWRGLQNELISEYNIT